jgi:DNA modification methylase
MNCNEIYLGDSLYLIDDLDLSPKLIIMSPPDVVSTNYSLDEYKKFLFGIYNKCFDKLDEHGVLISITTDRRIDGEIYTKHIDIINSLKDKAKLFNYKIWAKSLSVNLYILNYCHILCFRKSDKITNNKLKEFYPDVLLIERDIVKGYSTKDSFPTKLIEILVKNFTNEGDLVLDPFMGSGKTAVVAKKNKRNYIGFEIDEENVKIARKRVSEVGNNLFERL